MLTTDAFSSMLFLDLASLIEPMGYKLVEASRSEHKGTVSLRMLCYKGGDGITTEDLEAIYNVVYPRYSVLWTRDLELEVSSPGINRNIKDIGEFKIFLGKTVRVYTQSKSSYVVGKIEKADDDYLYLSSYLIEDTKEEGEEIRIEYSDISKAKLDYVTEAKGK
ncbi:MAG TPA: hypothetical protein IAA76_08200 [Candidatus Ornithospirochaeta stercorigallinarum]|nr:hypothetical protein [Candidatus Ornithospirochaeta stercorigallinarum]